ncbi:hypothetical protein [Pseudomonas sp.]|uniref:hypothetical protein n=1 Tax=Pseudomonas sp. TaxID=306 RepID=UPI003D106713
MNNAKQLEAIEELREALRLSDNRYNAAALQLTQLMDETARLTAELTVMCEAYIAGDHALVTSKVRGFALAYYQNLKPAHRRVH